MDVKLIKISLIQIHGGNKCFIYTCVTEVLRSLRKFYFKWSFGYQQQIKKKKKAKQLTVLSGSRGQLFCGDRIVTLRLSLRKWCQKVGDSL